MDSGHRPGDIEITDPRAMRALPHPVRPAILERLQRQGPATATQRPPDGGATPSVTSRHLRHLAGFGLVRDAEPGPDRRRRRWEAVARGFRFEMPEDPGDVEGGPAARVLSREMFLRFADLPNRWAAEVEPELDPVWRRLAGLADTPVVVSAQELAAIDDAIERVLAPYLTREEAARPADGRASGRRPRVRPTAAPSGCCVTSCRRLPRSRPAGRHERCGPRRTRIAVA